MRFAFTEEQHLVRDTVRGALERECPPARVRASWAGGSGRSPALWARLAELGLVGLTVPEAHGGLGGSELDLVLLLEECGRAALPEPILENTAVGVPLLVEAGGAELGDRWLGAVAAGRAILTVGLAATPHVADAHVADLLLLERDGEIHALARAAARLVGQPSVDGARRLFRVEWSASAGTRIATGEAARRAVAAAEDRGALAAAAELLGIAAYLVAVTVDYVKVRQQFGKPIGSFQAVKHHLADALGALEMARPVVYRAAHSVARALPERSVHVSMAKAFASEAAELAAKVALQCHGAIGYCFEYDLHMWMKRGWALARSWGDAAWHRARVGAAILGPESERYGGA